MKKTFGIIFKFEVERCEIYCRNCRHVELVGISGSLFCKKFRHRVHHSDVCNAFYPDRALVYISKEKSKEQRMIRKYDFNKQQ
jgi:hypothetical protein